MGLGSSHAENSSSARGNGLGHSYQPTNPSGSQPIARYRL
jgi:hypothetical protein